MGREDMDPEDEMDPEDDIDLELEEALEAAYKVLLEIREQQEQERARQKYKRFTAEELRSATHCLVDERYEEWLDAFQRFGDAFNAGKCFLHSDTRCTSKILDLRESILPSQRTVFDKGYPRVIRDFCQNKRTNIDGTSFITSPEDLRSLLILSTELDKNNQGIKQRESNSVEWLRFNSMRQYCDILLLTPLALFDEAADLLQYLLNEEKRISAAKGRRINDLERMYRESVERFAKNRAKERLNNSEPSGLNLSKPLISLEHPSTSPGRTGFVQTFPKNLSEQQQPVSKRRTRRFWITSILILIFAAIYDGVRR